MLDNMGEKLKMITVKFSDEMLAEFNAALKILNARSGAEHIHRFVVKSIEEAKAKAGAAAWEERKAIATQELQKRSEEKSKQRAARIKLVPVVAKPVKPDIALAGSSVLPMKQKLDNGTKQVRHSEMRPISSGNPTVMIVKATEEKRKRKQD